MTRKNSSADSLIEATKSRASFSGHGSAKGAAGHSTEGETGAILSKTGDTQIVDPREYGFADIKVGLSWDLMRIENPNPVTRLFKRFAYKAVDLDLGCLYELQNGERGVIQAFGDHYGALNEPPYIHLSGDERTGVAEGDDEYMEISGQHWPEIKRMLFYVYIYDGTPHWGSIRPRILVDVPGEQDMTATPSVTNSDLVVCAVAGIENVRNGIKVTNYTEYFPGHAEMDRAFGFGIQWDDGRKY